MSHNTQHTTFVLSIREIGTRFDVSHAHKFRKPPTKMASLDSYLPQRGSAVWRRDRQPEYATESQTIRHVVIRGTEIVQGPSPHVVSHTIHTLGVVISFYSCIVLTFLPSIPTGTFVAGTVNFTSYTEKYIYTIHCDY